MKKNIGHFLFSRGHVINRVPTIFYQSGFTTPVPFKSTAIPSGFPR